ncbi:hypothetical protein TNCV_1282211 [Trichonephila clavipes]|uniref:Uncharacterized protein n=1 Tax=Trichonephila clavipes TaxID=2585209 RepID=A0A8X6SZC9_TRICX|nr:hypothetical protein TNCV_1282211 [Trichonephila clavipes]
MKMAFLHSSQHIVWLNFPSGVFIIMDSQTNLHAKDGIRFSSIYRDIILKLLKLLLSGAMVSKFLFEDDNANPNIENVVDECVDKNIPVVWN